ncbi:MAG: class I adenylate-forming enzyme family protein [bacterium]
MNIFNNFRERAIQQPDHPAIIDSGAKKEYTYAQLLEEVELKAELLSRAGVQKGTCLGIHLSNSPDYIIMSYAAWRLGVCIVPIANEMALDEKVFLCRNIALDAIICLEQGIGAFSQVQRDESKNLYNRVHIVPISRSREHPEGFSKINPAFLRFTSGTTGQAKGVVISHESINERIQAANRVLKIGPGDRVMWLLSMAYHFTVSIVSYLSSGATIVLSSGFMGEIIIRNMKNIKCTIIYASPTHYQLMNNTGATELPDLRLAISTTSGLSPKISEEFCKLFNVPLSQAYGIIEVGLPFINLDNPRDKGSSVGRLLPDYEILLEDSGLGENLKNIKLRGKGFFDAYYEPWIPRQELLKNGWFDTGDLGVMDEEGFLFIKGRSKEMINIAGMKFFPYEVEDVLLKHPAVKEACVFPHAKSQFEELPYAYIVMHGDAASVNKEEIENELTEHCARHLSNYKVPRKIIFVDKLKRTASGKLIRH